MAKKVRGSSSTHRPGGVGPNRARRTSGTSTSESVSASEATASEPEALDATEVEYSEMVAQEPSQPVAEAAAPTPRRRRRTRKATVKADDLTARAAAETLWVREDLRRIAIVSVVLLVSLALAWVVFYALDILSLY